MIPFLMKFYYLLLQYHGMLTLLISLLQVKCLRNGILRRRRNFLVEVKKFYWDDPYLFKYCSDQIFRRCILDNEVSSVINFCHSEACDGHFSSRKTTAKILQSGFYWPTIFKDTYEFCKTCENCQKLRSITKRNMMPLNPILEIEIFDCWGIDFMGPFPPSFDLCTY